jgi:hypothetical protein
MRMRGSVRYPRDANADRPENEGEVAMESGSAFSVYREAE